MLFFLLGLDREFDELSIKMEDMKRRVEESRVNALIQVDPEEKKYYSGSRAEFFVSFIVRLSPENKLVFTCLSSREMKLENSKVPDTKQKILTLFCSVKDL